MINLGFKKRFQIAAIDFSNGWLKVAQAKLKAGQAELEPFVSVSEFTIEPDNKISRKEFNNLLWGILKVRPKAIYSCFPRHCATIRFLKLPSNDAAEIERMIEFQATKQLPFSIEDMVTGYKILNRGPDGFSKVMLAVAQKNVVDSHLGILKAAGITPESVFLSTEALFNWFLSTGAAKQISGLSLYLLIDVDSLFTELLICDKTEILFTRSFEHGAGAIHKSDKDNAQIKRWIDVLKEQLKSSYLAYKKENTEEDKKVQKIFVSGGALKFFKRIKEELEKEFNVSVEFCGEKEANFTDKPISLSKAIGIIRAPEKMHINLTPMELKTKRLRKQRKEELSKLYILSAIVLLCLFTLIGARFLYKELYLNYLNAEIGRIKPYADRVEVLTDKLKIARQQSEKNNTPLEILRELYSVTPDDISLSNFSLDADGGAMLRGISKSMTRVFETVQILEASKSFKNVKVIFTNKRKIGQEEIIDFQIGCVLK